MSTLVEVALHASKEADEFHSTRTPYSVLTALTSELGELADEVAIISGDSYKSTGPDGVIGEAIDVIGCAIDLIYKVHPNVTEQELIALAISKNQKWIDSIKARALKQKGNQT